jgi:hypothetical protein
MPKILLVLFCLVLSSFSSPTPYALPQASRLIARDEPNPNICGDIINAVTYEGKRYIGVVVKSLSRD